MPSTPIYGNPYPALSDPPNGPLQVQALAEWLETNSFPQLLRALFGNHAGYHEVLVSETSASTAYVDLATVGPTVNLTSTGTKALCLWTAQMSNATPGSGAAATVEVSGVTTIAASDTYCLGTNVGATGFGFFAAQFAFLTITPGANTYRMKYRVAAATTGTWHRRKLLVIAP